MALIAGERVQLAGASDASDARWWPVDALPTLAFDHAEIVAHAVQRLRIELGRSEVGSQLLPSVFTMDELRLAHEAVLSAVLDKRSFQKRMLESGIIRAAGTAPTSGKLGPVARLYAFVPRQKD
jgi:8-oxo-dGTP diphosphatase